MSKTREGNSRKKASDFKLNTLLEVTKAINQNLPDKDLYILFAEILENDLKIGKSIMFMHQEQDSHWKKVLEYGASENEINTDVESKLNHIEDIGVVSMESLTEATSFDVVIPVYNQSKILAYLMVGDLDEFEIKPSPIIKHLPFIQTLANIIAVAVENQRLVQESIKQERMNRELEMAREMQSLLFPKNLPDDDIIQIAAEYIPNQQVGGDYYDVIKEGDELFICLADVSGKGMSAALLMANFQANMRAIVRVEKDLKAIVEELNTRVWNNASGEKFITMFLARYCPKNRELNYVNLAHPAPILMLDRHEILLQEGSVGLGMFEELPFLNQGEIKVRPNSILFCYTDGVSELENSEGEAFEEAQLSKIISANAKSSASELNKSIIDSLKSFASEEGFHDDIALVTCRFF